MEIQAVNCCGIREISGISGHKPEAVMKAFAKKVYGDGKSHTDVWSYHYQRPHGENWRYAVFSAAARGKKAAPRYGDALRAYILKHKLGEVVETGVAVNPNSGNNLKAYIWTVDHEAVKVHVGLKAAPQGGSDVVVEG